MAGSVRRQKEMEMEYTKTLKAEKFRFGITKKLDRESMKSIMKA